MVKGMEAKVGLAEFFVFDVAIKVLMDIGAKYTQSNRVPPLHI